MAKLMMFAFPGTTLRQMYFVSQGVGYGRPNLRNDVLLVQFFLKAISLREAHVTAESYRPSGAANLSIDGAWGPTSVQYLKYFVDVWNRKDAKLGGASWSTGWNDGAVDAPIKQQRVGSIHHKRFVIANLNFEYADLYGVDVHTNLFKDPLLPAELADEFFFV